MSDWNFSEDGRSALTALITALDELDKLFATINDAYQESLHEGAFERWNERG